MAPNNGVEASKRCVFLTVFDLDSIVGTYGVSIRNARAADKCKQLLEVENRIISGHVDSVAGVLHLENHWTSLVITFRPPKILYGDSLRGSMPSNKTSSFQQWMCHMLSRSGHGIPESDISIYPQFSRTPFHVASLHSIPLVIWHVTGWSLH